DRRQRGDGGSRRRRDAPDLPGQRLRDRPGRRRRGTAPRGDGRRRHRLDRGRQGHHRGGHADRCGEGLPRARVALRALRATGRPAGRLRWRRRGLLRQRAAGAPGRTGRRRRSGARHGEPALL
ncbi:MAG: hypothetical protein AVDCRST_MAG20-1842, partial [uncultured Acidimicrobiales bacterium]